MKNFKKFFSLDTCNEIQYKILLLVISCIAFIPKLGVEEIGLMESRNFITAREIIKSGDWLLTTLNGGYRFEKPPLPTWSVATMMKIMNTTSADAEWIFRIPVALLSIWVIFLMFKFIKRLSGNLFLSFMISFIFSTSVLIMKEGVINTWDMFSYGFIFASIVYLVEGLSSNSKKDYLLFSICFSCSVMSKGPVAPYVMFITFLISYGFIYGFDIFYNNRKNLLIYLLFGILLSSLWPLYIFLLDRDLFVAVLMKEGKTWSSQTIKGYFYYCDYLFYTGVWFLFTTCSLFYYPWKNKMIYYKDTESDYKLLKFSVFWNLLILIFLSVIKMKKQRYGLPLYMCASIPCGIFCSYCYKMGFNILNKYGKFIFRVQSILLGVALALMPVVFLMKFKKEYSLIIISLVILYLFCLGLYIFLIKKYRDEFTKIVIIFSGAIMLLIGSTGVWFIYDSYLFANHKKGLPLLSEFQKEKSTLNIYSSNFKIEDVWKSGQRIYSLKKIDNIPDSNIDNNLESLNNLNTILFLGENSKELERLKENKNIKEYKIINQKEYYRNKISNKTMTLYEVSLIK